MKFHSHLEACATFGNDPVQAPWPGECGRDMRRCPRFCGPCMHSLTPVKVVEHLALAGTGPTPLTVRPEGGSLLRDVTHLSVCRVGCTGAAMQAGRGGEVQHARAAAAQQQSAMAA